MELLLIMYATLNKQFNNRKQQGLGRALDPRASDSSLSILT